MNQPAKRSAHSPEGWASPNRHRVALVTGGAVRLGRAIALGLADEAFDLAVNYHTSGTAAQELRIRVEGAGRSILLLQADVSNSAEVERVAGEVEARYGRLDLLVNNASLFQEGALLDVEEEEWDRVMAVNLKGPFLLVKRLAPLLAQSRGSVVNIVDLSALQPWIRYPHHSVSKAALLHLTRVLARALAPHVRVNAVAPGAVLPPEGYSEEELHASAQRSALKRLGTPEDVVRTVLFLDRSPYITGEVIVVDGGRQLEV